ncbi:hypothetical protein SPHINGOT1_390031 [Sphingomonas sp. T1]|nr:hypothetical protein SPHINGOT1_390031 [Sphingomonas sp. T1]
MGVFGRVAYGGLHPLSAAQRLQGAARNRQLVQHHPRLINHISKPPVY